MKCADPGEPWKFPGSGVENLEKVKGKTAGHTQNQTHAFRARSQATLDMSRVSRVVQGQAGALA